MKRIFTFFIALFLLNVTSFAQATGNVDLGSEITNGVMTDGCVSDCSPTYCTQTADNSGNHPVETMILTITGIPATNSVELVITSNNCGSTSGLDGGDDVFIDGNQVVDGASNLIVNQTECIVGGADIVISFTVNRRDETLNFSWTSGPTDPGAGCFLVAAPIELASFTAEKADRQVELNWSTISEVDNDYFDVQFSSDGINYKSIGLVEGAGTSTQKEEYSFIHDAPAKGINYYRLNQVDYSKASTYSEVATVEFRDAGTLAINPTLIENYAVVNIEKDSGEKEILVHNLAGTLVASVSTRESGSYELDLSHLASGTYIVSLISKATLQSAKVVKQ